LDEFTRAPGPVVLIAEAPGAMQIQFWAEEALKQKKHVAIRNIEPRVALSTWEHIEKLAKAKLLDVFHCPVQAVNPAVLADMKRDPGATINLVLAATELRAMGVVCATNIIVDYKDFENHFDAVYKVFQYVNWNPWWDGKWDRAKAEARFKEYLEDPPAED
jgi:hypothetical protein